jgi:hypothetical protein
MKGAASCIRHEEDKKKLRFWIWLIENSNFENRKLIVKMRISDHVLEIERGRYNKINGEQRICRQCHLNVIDHGYIYIIQTWTYNSIIH